MCILRNFLLHFFLFCSYFIAHFVWFLYFFAFRAFWIFFIWKWHFPDILVWFPKAEISHFGEFCLFFLSDFAHSCASMHSLDIFPKATWAHYPPPPDDNVFFCVLCSFLCPGLWDGMIWVARARHMFPKGTVCAPFSIWSSNPFYFIPARSLDSAPPLTSTSPSTMRTSGMPIGWLFINIASSFAESKNSPTWNWSRIKTRI